MLQNDLKGRHYVEPYAGGAGVALFLLYHEFAAHVHVNDVDPAIHAFWDAALHETEALCDRIEEIEVSVEEWERQSRILRESVVSIETGKSISTLELGLATFFLNRTNRSGILSGGIIGGKDQSGKWKIDARFNKENLIRRIEKVGAYSDRVTLYREDAANMISSTFANLPDNTLAYLDPPYYEKGQDLYANHYEDSDHAHIAALMSDASQPWIISYDNVDRIRELYDGYEKIEYSLSYSAQKRYKGSEAIFFSCGTNVPNVDNPASVSNERVVAAQKRESRRQS